MGSIVLNSTMGRRYVAEVRTQQVGQANVNGTKLAAAPIPLPSADEQSRIIAERERILSVIDSLENAVIAALKRGEKLRLSILSSAFTGNLVPEVRNLRYERQRDHRSEALELLQRAPRRRAVYQDYLEQLTFLLFLKMADERTKPPFSRRAIVPRGWTGSRSSGWTGTIWRRSTIHVLNELGKQPGMLGVIFRKAQNRIQDPSKLRRLVVDLIDRERGDVDADVKGDAYEGLLAKNAEDVKSGAGQYFTPRPLIQAMVEVMRPTASMRVCDPAAGTGGFLLAAYERMKAGTLDPDEKRFLRNEAFRGLEMVDATARLCAMNLLLHGIGAPESPSLITVDDALRSATGEHFDMVLTNPPFGRKSSYKVINAEGDAEREDMSYLREDFWATTSNKQLNFLQHVFVLKINGRAAVVVPDNVLFEGGAGETIRRSCSSSATSTRCCACRPASFTRGVKANVLFFDRKPARRSRGRRSCGSTTSAPTRSSR